MRKEEELSYLKQMNEWYQHLDNIHQKANNPTVLSLQHTEDHYLLKGSAESCPQGVTKHC